MTLRLEHDAQGRSYREVPVLPDGALKNTVKRLRPWHCVACRTRIRHGFDRYFQRLDPADGSAFDPVCGSCGDRLVAHTAVTSDG